MSQTGPPGGGPGSVAERANAMYSKIGETPQFQQLQGGMDNAAKKFGGVWKLLFFSNAALVTFAGGLALVIGLTDMCAPFDFVVYCYLTIFGLLMLVVDFPADTAGLRNFKFTLWQYALFMTRFLGRGAWYLFLAAMTIGALWDNALCPPLGLIMGAYIATVAVASLVYGIKLSMKVESLRKKIKEQGKDQWGAYIPPTGMSKQQFRDLAASLRNVVFSEEEMGYIVAAFSVSVRTDDVISREEFEDWVNSPQMMIL